MKFLLLLLIASFGFVNNCHSQEENIDSTLNNIWNKKNSVYIELLGVGATASINYLRKIPLNKNNGILLGIGYADFVGDFEIFQPLIPARVLYYHQFKRSLLAGGVDWATYVNYSNPYTSNKKYEGLDYWGIFEIDYQYHFNQRYFASAGFVINFYESEGIWQNWEPWGHLQFGYKF